MERACADYRESESLGSRLMVSSQTLVGAGMKTLLLSNLLLEALNQPLPSGNVQTNSAEMPLFAMAVEQMLSDKNAQIVLEVLPPSSPIHKPLTRIAAARTTTEASRLTALLSSWLARRNLTTGQLESLGLVASLKGRGKPSGHLPMSVALRRRPWASGSGFYLLTRWRIFGGVTLLLL